MDIKKRLFRRPFTTFLWLALVIVMTVSLCVSTALSYSTGRLIPLLDESHTTIATQTDKSPEKIVLEDSVMYTVKPKYFNQEDYDFFSGLDSVKNIYFHSMTGGYVPELTSVLGLNEFGDVVGEGNQTYDGVVFSATVKYVNSFPSGSEPVNYLYPFGLSDNEQMHTVSISLTVDEVFAQHPDIKWGMVGDTTIHVFGEEAVEYLKPGEKYLFAGRVSAGRFLQIGDSYNFVKDGVLTGYDFWLNNLNADGPEFMRLRSAPAIQKIETTAEDLIASSHEWQKIIDEYSTASSLLPIIGTDNLNAIYAFNNNEISIVEGRGFTDEEYLSGEKTCLISQTVALKSGIKLGDSIHISQYLLDESDNNSISGHHLDGMMNNPTVGETMAEYDFKTDSEEFKVIGIYRQTNEWEDSSYAFTPNTVFIPKKAQIEGGYGRLSKKEFREDINGYVNYESGVFGVLFSMELVNGRAEDFRLAISDTEWVNQFNIFDQGYDGAIKAMEGTSEFARSLILFAFIGWLMILGLYVLLYQGIQRKNVGIMRSLGAKPKQARGYLFISGFLLAAVGILSGTAISAFVNIFIDSKLAELMCAEGISEPVLSEFSAKSGLPLWGLLLLGIAQIAVFAVTLWLHASILSRKAPRKLIGG